MVAEPAALPTLSKKSNGLRWFEGLVVGGVGVRKISNSLYTNDLRWLSIGARGRVPRRGICALRPTLAPMAPGPDKQTVYYSFVRLQPSLITYNNLTRCKSENLHPILHPSFTLPEYHVSSNWRLKMKPKDTPEKYNPDLMYLAAVVIVIVLMAFQRM